MARGPTTPVHDAATVGRERPDAPPAGAPEPGPGRAGMAAEPPPVPGQVRRHPVPLPAATLGPGHPAPRVVSARGLSRGITATMGEAVLRPRRRASAQRTDGAEADIPGPAPAPKAHAHRLGAEDEDTRPKPAERRAVGRPGVVRDAAAAFAARLAELPPDADPAGIERLIGRLWAEELARHADKAPRTLKRITAEHYRPAVLHALGAGHPALAIVKLAAEVSDAIRRDDIARVAASHRAQVAVPRWREIVGRATALLASDAPLDLVAGLLLVTGRRPHEVCCTGRFAPTPLPGGSPGARSRWTVLFAGQAKTKNRPGTRAGVAYEIPVLAEARRVIAALDALRASPEGRTWAGMTNEEFRATTLRLALTDAVARAYGTLWPEGDRLEPRALRPLYAEIAHRWFGPAGVTKNSFFAAVLGHTLNDLHTSLSYMDYHLPEPGEDEGGAGAHKAAAGVTDRLMRQSRTVGMDPG